MRISELSRTSGVPLPTVKFYLREGLLHPGRATSATQAQYDDTHVRRLRLVRALIQVGGLSVAAARDVIAGVTDPHRSLYEVMGVAHSALPPQVTDVDPARALALVRQLGWHVHPETAALRQLEQALTALDDVGLAPSEEHVQAYAEAARRVAEVDVARVPRGSREEAATTVVAGTVLYEPVLLALRRIAQASVAMESTERARR